MIKEPRKNERKYKENNFTQKNPLQTFIIKKKKKKKTLVKISAKQKQRNYNNKKRNSD